MFRGGHDWREKVTGGWSISESSPFTPVTGGPRSIPPRTRSTATSATTDSRACVRITRAEPSAAPATTPSKPEATFQPRHCQYRHEQRSIQQQLLHVPNYSNAIADNSGQSAAAFIPPPGIGRNTFPGPGYRDLDMNLAKSFGLPDMRVVGENARIEIRANFSTHSTC